MNDLFDRADPNKDSTLVVNLNPTFVDQQHDMEAVVRDIARFPHLEYDTETTGLDPHRDKVIMIQIGTPERQWVIDSRKVNPGALQPILESSDLLKIGHNLAFDYMMMLGSFGIRIERVYDTFLGEQIIRAGLMKWGFGLNDCVLRHFKHKLSKKMQQSFINHFGDFTDNQKKYGALDVGGIVTQLMGEQIKFMQKHGLVETARLEMDAMQSFADMTFYGIPLNAKKWLSIGGDKTGEFTGVLGELNHYIPQNHMVEADMYGNPDFNWNSQKQVLALLQHLWPDMTSTGDDILDTLYFDTKNELIGLLRKYRKLTKKTGTYGAAYTNAIHPVTKRLHPRIMQIGTDTGRPSCKKPNVLNIPKELAYRVAFGYHPEEGRVMITIDYNGCELRIIADMSRDPFMCQAFCEGKDLHSFVTAMLSGLDYDNFVKKVRAKEVEAKKKRTIYKSLNFGRRKQLCRSQTRSIQGTLSPAGYGNPERISWEQLKRATTHSADRTPAVWVH